MVSRKLSPDKLEFNEPEIANASVRANANLLEYSYKHSLNNFRGVAILFVMLSHFRSFDGAGSLDDIFHFLVSDATSWFIFISGYFFKYLEVDKFSYRRYMWKKTKYVLLPYIILSIPSILIGVFSSREMLYGLTKLNFAWWSLLVGGATVAPMWFIPMIAVFFLCAPLFNFLAKSPLIGMFTILALVISIFTSRPINNLNPFLSFVHFSGFYMLGILGATQEERLKNLSSRYKILISSAALMIFVVSFYIYREAESQSAGFFQGLGTFNLLQFGKAVLLVAILLIFDMFLNKKNLVLGFLAEISFGLFFIHGFFLPIFNMLSSYMVEEGLFVRFTLEILVVVIFSIFSVTMLRRVLRKRSRYVIGC